MSCTRYRDLLSRYVDGEVTARQRRELLGHLEKCHDCAAWLARVRQTDVLLKGAPDTRPSDRVRDAVLGVALKGRLPGPGPGNRRPHAPRHAPFPAARVAGGWHLETAGLLMRLDVSPQRAALAFGAALLSMIGLAYWLNILPPLGGYDKFGFLFPHEQQPAPIAGAALPAVTTGYNGAGGSIAAPNLVRLTPPENSRNVAPQEPLRVRFDLPMDRSSVEEALRIDPPAAGAFSWDADNELRFTPAGAGLLKEITYTLTLSSAARSLAGTSLARPLAWSFRTVDPPSVTALEPAGSPVYPTATFTLAFGEPMDTSRTNDEVSLRAQGTAADLPVSLSWSQDGKTLYVAPLEAMPANTIVALRVGADAPTRLGSMLGYPSEFAHAVVLPTPRLRLLDGHVYIARAGGQVPARVEALESLGAPIDGVDFQVYSLPGERLSELQAQARNWPAALPQGLPGSLEKIRAVKGQAATEDGNPRVGRQDLSGLLPGTHLLIASARSQSGTQLSDWQLLIVADRKLTPADGGSWWATDENGKVWPGAEVSLYSPAGTLLEKGLTDNAGLWQPVPSAPPAWATLVIARDTQGHLAAVPLSPKSVGAVREPPVQSPKSSSPLPLSASLQTGLPSYRPGEQANFRVILHPAGPGSALGTPVSEQDVSISLLNPGGAVVSVLNLKPDSVGGVSGLFEIAPSVQPGLYTLRVKAGDAWRDFPLEVLPPRSDTLSVFIAPPARTPSEDKASEDKASEVQAITRTVSVLGPRGEAASGALLTGTLGILGDVWSSAPVTTTAGPDGRATLVVPVPRWTGSDPAASVRPEASYYDPGQYLEVEAAWQGNAGSDRAPLDLMTARHLLSGVSDLASPSLGIAASAYLDKDKARRLSIVALNKPASPAASATPGDLLVIARTPGGERQDWAVDLAGAGGEVTLPVPARFAGGSLYFARAGVEGSRELALPASPVEGPALTLAAPASTSPNAPLPVKLQLLNVEDRGVEGNATVWFRRASGEITSSRRGWEPSRRIDATGTATATLAAPDAPGLWYVMAAATTAEGGYATAWSVIEVLPGPTVQLPPAQVAPSGEARIVSVAVYNPTAASLSGGLRAEGGALQVMGTSSQGVDVAAGGWQRLDWGFAAPPAALAPGRTGLAFSFLPSAGVEGTWTLAVRPTANPRTDATHASGVLSGQKTVGVLVPSGLPDSSLGLEIHASSSLLSALADAAGWLQGEPRSDATAALAERLSAAPAIASAYRRAGLPNPPRAGASELERAAELQQLYSAQHPDGGWGADLDPTSGPSSPSDTAGVLLALWRQGRASADAGAINPQPEIDEGVRSRALAYLARESFRPPGDRPSTALLDERARSFYVLSLYGAAKPQVIRPLMAYAASSGDGARLSRGGMAWLALALWQAGSMEDAQALVESLLETQREPQDASTAAPMLEALVTIPGPKSGGPAPGTQYPVADTRYLAEAQPYARALMESRQGPLWATPATSADALWALAHYAPQETEKPAAQPSLLLNDRSVQATAQADNPGSLSIVLSGSALHPGTNWLKLQAPNVSQPLYYSLTLRATR